jgi:methionine-rich copper-binding protein CopC
LFNHLKRSMFGILVMVLMVHLICISSVFAHAKLVASIPQDGAKLNEPPAQITLVFDEEIDGEHSSFTVTNTKGGTVGLGQIDTSDRDHKTLTSTVLDIIESGAYTVTWSVETRHDNAQATGSIRFTIGIVQDQQTVPTQPVVQPTASARPTVATQPPPALSDRLGFLLGVGAIAVLVGALAIRYIWLRRRR